MKVADLIALLQQQDPDLEVHQTEPSHDYWGSVLTPVTVVVEVVPVRHSQYHNEWCVEERDPLPTDTQVLVLRARS